jgi:prepilin signal peptidase PulO-like enzyme (type II secretory pathway)
VTESPEPPPGTLRPSRLSVLAAVFVVAALAGYVFVPLWEAAYVTAPQVGWPAVAALALIAGMLAVSAWTTYTTVHRDRRRMPSQRAVNLLLLAKASALVGAVVAGGYLGFGLNFVDQLEVPLPRERAVRSLVAAVIGVAIVICATLLERACRIPKGPDP